jgi:hypothetical protein
VTSHTYNPADEVQRLIAEGRISEDAITAVTGIPPEKLKAFFAESGSEVGRLSTTPPALSFDESTRLTILSSQLTDLILFDNDDERLMGLLESLTVVCRLTLENISRLTGVGIEDLQQALDDPRALPVEKKYELAMRGSYLVNAVNAAHGNPIPLGD